MIIARSRRDNRSRIPGPSLTRPQYLDATKISEMWTGGAEKRVQHQVIIVGRVVWYS